MNRALDTLEFIVIVPVFHRRYLLEAVRARHSDAIMPRQVFRTLIPVTATAIATGKSLQRGKMDHGATLSHRLHPCQ